MHLTICVDVIGLNHFGVGLRKLTHFRDFYISVSSDLDLWLFDFKITLPYTRVLSDISIKCEISTVFQLLINERYLTERQTDGQTLRQVPKITRFRWWGVLEDICRMARRSWLSSLFDMSLLFTNMCEKWFFLRFRSQQLLPLTCWTQICSPS